MMMTEVVVVVLVVVIMIHINALCSSEFFIRPVMTVVACYVL
jgi:hypothetical protein